MTRKLTVLFALAVVVAALMAPGVANANFAIHGGYTSDTDACAGCHRTHTAFGSMTWSDGTTEHSALLINSATTMYEFCYACHGADAQGADTNVQQGVYEGTLYGTQGAILNGGGFESVGVTATTSSHLYNSTSWWAYGGGVFGAAATDPSLVASGATGMVVAGMTDTDIQMDCATCHDPHGSSNYRILKDMVYGNRVGGFFGTSTNPTPTPWVWSTEPGYPAEGFRTHTAYTSYVPNFTTPMYARGETWTVSNTDVDGISGALKGMTGWCTGCHGTYMTKESTYNAGDLRLTDDPTINPFMTRHRHPMNVPLSNFNGTRALIVTTTPSLPLAHDRVTEVGGSTLFNSSEDWVECLTCHRAHGTSVTMTGWADSQSNFKPVPNTAEGVPPEEAHDGKGNGNDGTALLRENNRTVCEACHNK